MIRVEPMDASRYKWRFFVDDKPTSIYLRKGGGRYRWQAVIEIPTGSMVELFSGGSRIRMVSAIKLLLEAGVKLGGQRGPRA